MGRYGRIRNTSLISLTSERDGRDHTAPKGLLATILTTGFRFTFRGATRESAVGSSPARNSGRRGSGRCPEQRMPQLMPANGGYCAHQRYRVWHECLEPGRLPRHGAQPHLTPHGKCGYPLEHWADVRRDSSVIFRRARQTAPSTCQVGLVGCGRLAVHWVHCKPMQQISAQISNFWVLEALCSAAAT